MGLIYDSGSICPQHWRNNQWQKTGDTNPLPVESWIWNGTTWVQVGTSNPLPVMTIGANSASLNPIAVTQAPKSSFQTMKTFTGTVTVTQTVNNPSSAPTLSASANAGSTLPANTYYVKYTWLNANGESLPSPEASQAVSSGQQLNVTIPSLPPGATSANIYISTSSGTETLQRNITSTSTSFTAPLSSGAALPTTSTINTTVQNLYTVTSGKTFYLTDIVVCNNNNQPVQVSVNASQTPGTSPIIIGHTINTAPFNAVNIGTEPSVAGGTPITFQVSSVSSSPTPTVTFFISGYEQ